MIDDEIATAEPRTSQADRAYRALKDKILRNILSPGQQMLEQEAAEELAMSRTPVREAMVRLAQEGFVEIRPRHGMRVLPISPDDMAEIFAILTGLESIAAQTVAARRPSPAEIAPLDAAVADMEEALERDDLEAWASADRAFHTALVKLAGNRRLETVVFGFWDQAHRVRMATLRLRPKPTASNDDHAALIAAIVVGDAERARRIHHDHRMRAGEMLVRLLRDLGLRQL